MKINNIILSVLTGAAIFSVAACKEDNPIGNGPSDAGFFSQETLAYNLTSNPVINIPVVRLGTKGELPVSVTSSGSSQFKVAPTVTIKDGERLGVLEVSYDPKSLTFNEQYYLTVSISGFNSIYGYGAASVIIEYPTSYSEYGAGFIKEQWWGEQEDKTMFTREYAADVYQCYLPDCWGHDSGPDYDVKDYVFFWNTATNKVYIPIQLMGTDDWSIADQGAIACRFGGPDYKEGSAEWMKFIDDYYKTCTFEQPHYDPEKKAFYLSDSAAISPATGEVVYGTAGTPDIFFLD